MKSNTPITVRELVKELAVSNSTAVNHSKHIDKSKKLDKSISYKSNENQRNRSVPRTHFSQQKRYVSRLHRNVRCKADLTWQPSPFSWLCRDEVPRHFPKPKLHAQKITVPLRWSSAGFIPHSFLNPEKYYRYIHEMYQILYCICTTTDKYQNVYNCHRSSGRVGFGYVIMRGSTNLPVSPLDGGQTAERALEKGTTNPQGKCSPDSDPQPITAHLPRATKKAVSRWRKCVVSSYWECICKTKLVAI